VLIYLSKSRINGAKKRKRNRSASPLSCDKSSNLEARVRRWHFASFSSRSSAQLHRYFNRNGSVRRCFNRVAAIPDWNRRMLAQVACKRADERRPADASECDECGTTASHCFGAGKERARISSRAFLFVSTRASLPSPERSRTSGPVGCVRVSTG